MDVRKLIDKLAAEEEAVLKNSILAPVVRGGRVCVRIRGVICRFRPTDRDYEGWGIFKPVSLHEVKLEKTPSRTLIRKYQKQLVSVSLILGEATGSTRPAVIAHPAGSPVKVDGHVFVHLIERADLFRHVLAGFDGFNFWFERLHPGRNSATAAYLRKSLDKDLEVESLRRPGLLPQERKLYSERLETERIRKEEPERRRLRTALEHAGAELDSYNKRGREFTVNFLVDGVRHTSRIRARDLTVLSAGICLSGEDRRFDLQSLVSVLREAEAQDEFD
jgi:hypothetical protein